MKCASSFVLAAVGLTLIGARANAQDLSRYRTYVLESSLESVVAATGPRANDAKTLHERPAKIQELEWRAPYLSSDSELADPVKEIAFTFLDEALYQIVVTYDRDRTNGLTNDDVIESVSATYGEPVITSGPSGTVRPAAALPDTIVVARWENVASSVTLLRGAYAPDFQLILISKRLSARARTAIREAVRLDALEAPRRELERRKKEAAEAGAARDKTRTTNKAAFRP